MVPPELPEHVVGFVRRHIHSVLQLEILLLLRARAGVWTPFDVAKELRITDQSATLHLRDLQLRGLIDTDSGENSYRYEQKTRELSALVDELAECYAAMRYTMINLIFSEPGDSARSLAEAFRVRRKKEE